MVLDAGLEAARSPLHGLVLGAITVLAATLVLSPLSVFCGILLVLLFRLGGAGLSREERRLVLCAVGVAIAVRVAMIAGLFLFSDQASHYVTSFPFDGDGLFMKRRSMWLRNIWLGIPVEPFLFRVTFDPYGWTSYVQVIAFLQYFFGEAPFAIHLFTVFCSVAGALLLHRTVRASYGAVPALVALVVMLFMPTLVMWSSSALKESLYFLLTAAVLFGLMKVARSRGTARRFASVALVGAAAVGLHSVRTGAWLFVAAAVGIALAGSFLSRRVYLLIGAIVIAWFLGGRLLEMPQIQSRIAPRVMKAAVLHIGHVRTEGHSYKLLDQRFYSGDPLESITWPEIQRFISRALYSFAVVPLPWDAQSKTELFFVPQQLIWYGLLLLSIPGVLEGFRRDVYLTWLLIGFISAGALVIAPNVGNVGTLVRFRDSIVPLVASLSALGGTWMIARGSRARGESSAGGVQCGFESAAEGKR